MKRLIFILMLILSFSGAQVAAETCTPGSTSQCSDAQVCERSTYIDESGERIWHRVLNFVFVLEAIDRNLTCSSEIRPTLLEILCSEDTKFCSDEFICEKAAIRRYDTGEVLGWNTSTNEVFVQEAQRRGLTCEVVETVQPVLADTSRDCSNKNLQLCDNSILCARATRREAGTNKVLGWHTLANQEYVQEAKRRGLTCGVVETVQPTATVAADLSCPENPQACSDWAICNRARRTNSVGVLEWQGAPFEKYVQEAKRRGLTCGVVETVQPTATVTADVSCLENPQACSEGTICRMATTKNSDGVLIWQTSLRNYIQEAQRRGLTCGVVETVQKNSINTTCNVFNLRLCNDSTVCTRATYLLNNGLTWRTSTNPEWVQEAQKRGLTCGVVETVEPTATVTADVCSLENPHSCSDWAICNRATKTTSVGTIVWQSAPFEKYVQEAQWRGLTCGVVERMAPAQNDYALIDQLLIDAKSYFNSMPRLDRQRLQYALNLKGLYPGPMDGLWGPNTEIALKSYINAKGLMNYRPNQIVHEAMSSEPQASGYNPPAPRVVESNQRGLRKIVSNPSLPADQAWAVCEPQARVARSQTVSAYKPTSSGGGFATGFINGMNQGLQGNTAYRAVLDSCLATYGWSD